MPLAPLPDEYSRDAYTRLSKTADTGTVARVLVWMVHNENDADWAHAEVVKASRSSSDWVGGVALSCLGHLTRIHRKTFWSVDGPILEDAVRSSDPEIRSRAAHAAWDMFVAVGVPARESIIAQFDPDGSVAIALDELREMDERESQETDHRRRTDVDPREGGGHL